MKIAIIGTAGRDKSKPMTRTLWNWMIIHATRHIPRESHLVSGGAAWADHLAVELFLMEHAAKLTLHLPAPYWDGRFHGPMRSAASAANHYHWRFSKVVGYDTLSQIGLVADMEHCYGSFQPTQDGYAGMFARNKKVAAEADKMFAYTFGTGDEPADGGTKNTWDQCKGERIHVPLPILP